MSIARHHAEWLSLVEVSGPFLSLPVLMRAFSTGLEKAADESELLRKVRLAFEEWEDSRNPAIHQAWIKFVLNDVLELTNDVLAEGQAVPQSLYCNAPEHGETLRPNMVVITPKGRSDADKVRLLINTYPADQDLDKPVPGKPWKVSPGTRMMELCHATGVRLGLVTNGHRWMLVDAPKNETTGFASWYASLWLDQPDKNNQPIYFRSFQRLLNLERFFGVPDKDTLEALLAESASNQQEVTDQLGYQVRNAVETLIQALDKADQEHGRELLADVTEAELYEAALNVMMRLVFLFCAEERGLLLLGDPLFNENYAVSTLRERLRETADQQGEEILERRHDAWCRLLSTFRAVHGGVEHERMSIPAYAGHLFDPDRFTFLEGRKRKTEWQETPADPLPVNNRTVLHLLEALQLLQVKVPGGGPAEARRLSFRALDIEQIGHVYEGLLDHTAKRATEPILGLAGSKDKEPEIPLSKLEELHEEDEAALVEFVEEETGKQSKTIQKLLSSELEEDRAGRFHTACNNDQKLWKRVEPFAGLVRDDSYGYPVVIPKGSVYVAAGTDRRSSGTHYTPRSLTEPIVQYTLEPLAYEGPAEGKPREEWKLRSAKELLDLKICDMACGSGAFLVQACRYLSELVVEAWEKAEDGLKAEGTARSADAAALAITPYGEPATGKADEQLIPKDADERITYARRIVAQRCLYGVDINPLAVEMAKLSLWLLTLAKDRPFTFLDHAIRCGDSLVGISSVDQLVKFSLSGGGLNMPILQEQIKRRLDATRALRTQIESLPDATPQDVERKELMFHNVEQQTSRLRYAADMLVAASWQPMSEQDQTEELKQTLLRVERRFKDLPVDQLELETKQRLVEVECKRTFHWPLEFPEVFLDQGGFDAFIGNPPFMGGRMISGSFGSPFREFVVAHIADHRKGHADLCSYFFLRASSLVHDRGTFGLVATNTIAQGDTREVGLGYLTQNGHIIFRGIPSQKWPGAAALEVAHVWVRKGQWNGIRVLSDTEVSGITSLLSVEGGVSGNPFRLAANAGKSFQGSIVLGMGFVLEPEEARRLISCDSKNERVLRPYLNGADVNSRPDQSPSRWVINFSTFPLDRRSAPKGYSGPVAADYPKCLKLVEERVKPERLSKSKEVASAPWWQFWRVREELYAAIANLERVIVIPETTKFCTFSFYSTDIVFSHMVKLIVSDQWEHFAILSSSIHEEWARTYSSTLETRLKYITTDAFETFPFPVSVAELASLGEEYATSRSKFMLDDQEGITDLYNRFHDKAHQENNIVTMRRLHARIDEAVAKAYGWNDLKLDHDFHQTKQGVRFTISEKARREVLTRLLKLNHEQYAVEVAQGLHGKKVGTKKVTTTDRTKRGSKQTALPGFGDDEPEPVEERESGELNGEPTRQRTITQVSADRPTPIAQRDITDIMAAFRQAARGRGWLDRTDLLKEVSSVLGYQRLGPKIEDELRNHLRAAIRRRIIEADGQNVVRAGTSTMADYGLDDLRETFASVMRKGTSYEREDVIQAVAHYLGFARLTENSREPLKSAINSAIRHGLLGYEGSVVWRET